MRIAMLPSADLSYESGSVIHAKRLLSYLLERGHDVCVLASRTPSGLSATELRSVYVDDGVLEHPVIDDRPVQDSQLAESLSRGLRFLTERHAERSIDLVHAQYLSFTSMAAATFGAATRTPVIISSFGRDLSIGLAADPRLAAMARLSLHGTSHLIAPNDAVRVQLERLQLEAGTDVAVTIIPPPLDPRVLRDHRAPAVSGRPLLATVNSCFTPEKGIDTIIRAFATVKRKFPEAVLVVAGADDHPAGVNRERLSALVEGLMLGGSVLFPGYLDRSAVGGLVAAADLFIDARTKGNFSSVVLEAQFIGAAVLCSDVPAARIIIINGHNGELFPPGDPRQLAEHITRLLESPQRRAELRQGCSHWCAASGAWYLEANAMRRIEEIYEGVIAAAARLWDGRPPSFNLQEAR
jgi:glycosyltransferase involved in cell wall biosynthesis